MFKDELNGMCMINFCATWAKTYAFRHYDDEGKKIKEEKKAKETKKSITENDLKLDGYKNSALKNKIILRSQQRFKSDHHNVFTEEVNKVVTMTREYKILMRLQHMYTEHQPLKFVNQKC